MALWMVLAQQNFLKKKQTKHEQQPQPSNSGHSNTGSEVHADLSTSKGENVPTYAPETIALTSGLRIMCF
jgi:hypothetical protein